MHGVHQPHLPFTQLLTDLPVVSDFKLGEARASKTIEHAHWILARHGSLNDMNIVSAENTSRLVNAGKINPGLLAFLISALPQEMINSMFKKSHNSPKKAKRKLSHMKNEIQGLVEPFDLVAVYHRRENPVLDALNGELGAAKEDALISHETNEPAHQMSTGISDNDGMAESIDEAQMLSNKAKKRDRKAKTPQSIAIKQDIGAQANPLEPSTWRLTVSEQRNRPQVTVPSRFEKDDAEAKPWITSLVMDEATTDCASRSIEHSTGKGRDPKGPILGGAETFTALAQAQFIARMSTTWQVSFNSEQVLRTGTHESNPRNTFSNIDKEYKSERNIIRPRSVEDSLADKDSAADGPAPNRGMPLRSFFDLATKAILVSETFNSVIPDSGYSSPVTNSVHLGYGSGQHGLQWVYPTSLEALGVWLWEKPVTYYQETPVRCSHMSDFRMMAPVIISPERSGTDEPILEFDGEWVQIIPHTLAWPDVRSEIDHPDFLVPTKLCEYQACEIAGYQIWRHDRNLLRCRESGCNAITSDYCPSTVVCVGCGPKTLVRYCSFQHQVADIGQHWDECGQRNLVMQKIIDSDTAPNHFYDFCPAVRERNGFGNTALYRQRLFASVSNGLYTLFDPLIGSHTTLLWPRADPNCLEMNERIERLLNSVFFDCSLRHILHYLYRLLREILVRSSTWTIQMKSILEEQFSSEFGSHNFNPVTARKNPLCEYEWFGKEHGQDHHTSSCPLKGFGVNSISTGGPRYGIHAYVERTEDRYWILRAWRQQHPMLKKWRSRANGWGMMALGIDGDTFELGPGFTGWGGKEDDICI